MNTFHLIFTRNFDKKQINKNFAETSKVSTVDAGILYRGVSR